MKSIVKIQKKAKLFKNNEARIALKQNNSFQFFNLRRRYLRTMRLEML